MNWFRDTLLSGWQKPNILAYSLLPLSLIYLLVIKLRRIAFQVGLLKSKRFDVPVIVVGNLTVGGTGKTPLVIFLVEQLAKLGYKPGVISRGYGGAASSWPQHVDQQSDPVLVGDEPVLIARRTKCSVVVGPIRNDNITVLLEQYDCDLVISDDGLQHYAMQRDIEIAVIDTTRNHRNHFVLPAGPYRELNSRLNECDLRVYHTEANKALSDNSMQLVAGKPVNMKGKVPFNNGKQMHAIAGIGHPQRFFKTCKQQGYDIVEHSFDDHYSFKLSDISFEDNLQVLMTEKDAVKCFKFAKERHYYLPVSAKLTDNFIPTLNELIQKLNK